MNVSTLYQKPHTMNVLMFGWEFPPNISGGLGTACYGIVKGLSSIKDLTITFVMPKLHGNELTINNLKLISAENVSITAYEDMNFSHVSFLKVQSQLIPYITPESFSKSYSSEDKIKGKIIFRKKETAIRFSGKYGPNLYEEINNYATIAENIARENTFQIIHAHDWLTFPAAIKAKHISGKPLIVHIHSTDFDRSGGHVNSEIYNIEKTGMEEADKIITVSDRIKKRLIEQYMVSPEKIITIYNAIEKTSDNIISKRKKRHKVVTFLGRITIQKGPEYFVEVARLVINKMKNVHFVMAGNGEMREKIIDLCARYGIGNRFHFAGFLNGREVSEMLNQSDIFIMPSVSEPFGIVPLEAMQADVPVIISLQSGVSELINNVIKTDFWDTNAMADAVYNILKHNKLSETLTKEGRHEVEKLSWENSGYQINKVYRSLFNIAS